MSADDSHMSVTHSGAAAVVADVQVIYPPPPSTVQKVFLSVVSRYQWCYTECDTCEDLGHVCVTAIH